MTTSKTLILVDVDGVIRHGGDISLMAKVWGQETLLTETIVIYDTKEIVRVDWSNGVIMALREFEAIPGVTMMWCTSWQQYAPELLGHALGIGTDWDYVRRPDEPDDLIRLTWWKETAARRLAPQFERMVWIDDEIDDWETALAREGRHWEWIDDKYTLTVCPDSETGLTPADIDQIRQFLAWRQS